jgi:cytochrome P450
MVMRQFTPARVDGMHDRIVALVDGLIDAQRGNQQFDVVDDFAYPLPVTVIC